jgi:hypothetical protein
MIQALQILAKASCIPQSINNSVLPSAYSIKTCPTNDPYIPSLLTLATSYNYGLKFFLFYKDYLDFRFTLKKISKVIQFSSK